ncbi:MAG: hypothetical protein IH604_10670 [Burkholderiales bacterium]|nr:hypothetical protein [Burkholderiales bacterium]
MHVDEIVAFMRQRKVMSVALISEQKAGKTTLLASIYERYCKGPFAGMSFAGSRTLVGFARRHHKALLSSGGSESEVTRTSRDDPAAFFHLCLKNRQQDLLNLVISDRSGETYGDARTDTDLISRLTELSIATRACVLLDGAKLASKESRPAYARQFKQMMHALNDNGALRHMTHVEVLATKFDVTHSRDDAVAQTEFLGAYEAQLVREFAERGLAISCYRICALPKKDVSVGFKGLEELLERWTTRPVLPSVEPSGIAAAERQLDRYLDRVEKAAT